MQRYQTRLNAHGWQIIENLERLALLEELWLGKNKIRGLEVRPSEILSRISNILMTFQQNLSTFKHLKILSLQSNRITKMENLEELESLEELYLSHNGLSKIEGLEKNVRGRNRRDREILTSRLQLKLKTLDVGNNQISKIENISHLKNLEEFWVSPPHPRARLAPDSSLRSYD